MVCFRVAWWFKNLEKGSSDPITTLLWNIKEGCSDPIRSKNSKAVEWVPPPLGSFEFNVDGSARGSPGQAGIGGVLRDHGGRVVCLFSANVGIQNAVTAEIFALARATSLCMSNPAFISKNIVFESDSKVVVSWINGQGIGILDHVQNIYDIRNHFLILGNASVMYCSRASNSFADMLAKNGSSGGREVLYWNVV